ncbi:uncharacterized protein [Eleutherodactylus coqui]|uniref:uncharacterized protein isoform X2 n=1 Tax=Eleutherodactylus coqui TaxID=57060 RepID=UPI0034632675
MAAAADESIKLSIEETDGFINLKQIEEGRSDERSDGEVEPPDPSRKRLTNQMGGTQSYKQLISVAWRFVEKHFWQFCQIIWKRLHNLYICCSEDPTVCNLLLLVFKRCHYIKWPCELTITMPWPILGFDKNNFCQEPTLEGSHPNEAAIMIDDDDEETCGDKSETHQ